VATAPGAHVRCAACGRADAGDVGGWCGRCGARLVEGDVPAAGPAVDDHAAEDGAPPDDEVRGRRSWWRWVAAAVVVALLVVGVRAGWDETAPAPSQPERATSLVGFAGDATGRSSTLPPAAETVRRWAVQAPTPRPVTSAFPVAAVGTDAIAIGDRVLALADGRVLGAAGGLGHLGARLTPDGLLGDVVDDQLVLVDPLDRRPVVRVPLDGGPVRGPTGGRSTELVGWSEGAAVLRTWDVGLGSSTTWAVDPSDGAVRWTALVDAYAPVGGGWFVGVAAPGAVLVDATDGSVRPVPRDVAGRLVGEPVVVEGVAYAATETGAAAWDPTSGAVLWAEEGAGGATAVASDLLVEVVPGQDEGTRLLWRDPSTGAQERVEVVELAGGRVDAASFAGIGALDDLVVVASPTGVRGVGGDGREWFTDVPRLVGVAMAEELGLVVALAAETGATATGASPIGPVEAIVLDRDGREVLRAPVGPVGDEPAVRIAAVVDDELVIDDPAVLDLQRVVSLEQQRPVSRGVSLARWTGDPDPAGGVLVGVVDGAPGPGGRGPLVLSGGAVVSRGVVVPLGEDRLPGTVPVVVDRTVAVATVAGTRLVPLPPPGVGTAVGRVAARAVGAPSVGRAPAVPRPSATAVVEVPGVDPAAAVGDLLLVTAREVDGSVPAGALAALDPTTGARRWTSTVTVRPGWPRAVGPVVEGAAVGSPGSALRGDDGPVVVVDGGTVVALDPTDGGVVWALDLGDALAGPAVLLDDRVVVALPTALVAVDLVTGAEHWRVEVAELVTALTGAGATAVAGTAGGDLLVVTSGGSVADRIVVGPSRVDDVVVVDGTIVAVTADRAVAAYGPRIGSVGADDRVEVP
jgi:outer membrane protein assembly factor BamB